MNPGHLIRYEKALQAIRDLIVDMPNGIDYDAIDYDADGSDQSPYDLAAHIGGLVWQIASEALDGSEEE